MTLIHTAPAIGAEDIVRIMSGGPNSVKTWNAKKTEFEKAAGATVEVKESPNDSAAGSLEKGFIDGIISAHLEELNDTLTSKNLPTLNPKDYDQIPTAETAIKVGLHPDNPSKTLTDEQISGILSGKIKTWEAINGKKESIVVLIPKAYIASMRALAQHYIQKDEIPNAQYVVNTDGLLKGLQRNPSAIAFFTRQDKSPDFSPHFFSIKATYKSYLIVKKSARPSVRKLFEYVKLQPTDKR